MHLRQKARRQLGGPHRVILVLQRRLTTFCNPSQLKYLAFFLLYFLLYSIHQSKFPAHVQAKKCNYPVADILELKAEGFLDGSPSHICCKSISETMYILKKGLLLSILLPRAGRLTVTSPSDVAGETSTDSTFQKSIVLSVCICPSISTLFQGVCSVRSSTRSSRCDASGISLSISSFFCLTFHTVFVRHCKSRIMSFRKAYRDFKIWLKTSYNYVITHVDSSVCTIAGARN